MNLCICDMIACRLDNELFIYNRVIIHDLNDRCEVKRVSQQHKQDSLEYITKGSLT